MWLRDRPWSGKLNGFTLLFEAFLLQMCRSMPVHHVCKLTHISDHRLWSLLENYVDAARIDDDHSTLHTIGMDETSAARGHDYITLFVDLETKKTVFVTDGKSNETVKDFSRHSAPFFWFFFGENRHIFVGVQRKFSFMVQWGCY